MPGRIMANTSMFCVAGIAIQNMALTDQIVI